MHINLHLLRIFFMVADHRSFSRAAEVLHVSQPAVSKAVRELERQRFLELEWPQLRTRLRRLGLHIDQLRLDDDKTLSAGGAAR